MVTTNRQESIAGWNQKRLQQAHIAVVGSTEEARQATWGAQSLGIGCVTRLAVTSADTARVDLHRVASTIGKPVTVGAETS
jgi:hypothetical protein